MAETVKFSTNVPVGPLALKFDDGLTVESRYGGDQICYTLADDRRLYASPVLARKLSDAGITRGVPFAVCKAEIVEGSRRRVEWQVTRLEPEAASAPTPRQGSSAPAVPAASAMDNGTTHSNGNPPVPAAADDAFAHIRRSTQTKLTLYHELCQWAAQEFGGSVGKNEVQAFLMNSLIEGGRR